MKFNFNIWQLATLGLLLLFLWKWNCGHSNGPTSHYDTTWHHYIDSSGPRQPTIVYERQGAVPVSVPVYVTIPPTQGQPGRIDTVWKPLDSLEVVKAYFTSRYYSDSLQTKFGKIYVKNKVTENRLDSQQIFSDLTIPEITRTVDRGQVYVGGELLGTKLSILNGAGANLGYKTKGNKFYEVGVVKIGALPLQVKAGFKILLSLKKRK